MKFRHPKARCLWRFSKTTFFHTPIEGLPAGTDGQSCYPYGTGTRTHPQDEDFRDKPELKLDGFVPRAEFRIPEGSAQTFLNTESMMRLLNPEARRRHPPGVGRFHHYMVCVRPTPRLGSWRFRPHVTPLDTDQSPSGAGSDRWWAARRRGRREVCARLR